MFISHSRASRFLFIAPLLAAILAFGAAPQPTIVPVRTPAITTLLFHQVTAHPIVSAAGVDNIQKPWLSPAEFEKVLDDAEAAGYTYVTLDEAAAFFHGRALPQPLPPKALLITFDDGYQSVLPEVTPILKKHHAQATMFFEGVLTGVKAGRLTVNDLKAMRASGVWALQSHGWMGHSNLVVDAKGTLSPYWYANLAWRPAEKRLETPAEFSQRIRADFHRFRQTFEAELGQKFTMFAYPSGEFGQNSPLLPGGEPNAKLEAGHSNAAGLTLLLEAALRDEGFDTAFAVSIPGISTAASRADDPYALPRFGVGADFAFARVAALQANGIQLPEIAQDRFADPGPVARLDDGFLVASTDEPIISKLSIDGRFEGSWRIDALMDDRSGNPSLISALVPHGSDVYVFQKSGWWPNATPRLTLVHLDANGAAIRERKALPSALNWMVGVAERNGALVGLTDDGTFWDVASAKPLAQVALPPNDGDRKERFSGPVVLAGALAAYDRKTHRLTVVDEKGAATAAMPLPGDLTNFTVHADDVYAVDSADKRHILETYRVSGS
jgi:peptidoglycan/xylan/chitin deacetylase (PgdA/CDA1 family)